MEFLNFALIIGKLKKLKRAGWVRRKIPDAESVAGHSFRLTVLVLFFAVKAGVDQVKAVKMALIHDLGEAEIGDIVTRSGRETLSNLSDKIQKERKALESILSLTDSKEYIQLFDEYEKNSSPEAQLVRQLDKLEMGIQALEYEREYGMDLEEFFETCREDIKNEELLKVLDEMERLRRKKRRV